MIAICLLYVDVATSQFAYTQQINEEFVLNPRDRQSLMLRG